MTLFAAQGPDITARNSRLVRQGEVCKVSSSGWAREVTLFLFDSELVMCKKDLIKRSSLVCKDRLSVRDVELIDPVTLMDGRPHAFQLRSYCPPAKCYTLSCRSEQEKQQWLGALRQLQQEPPADWLAAPAPGPSPDPHSFATLGRQSALPTSGNKRSKGECGAMCTRGAAYERANQLDSVLAVSTLHAQTRFHQGPITERLFKQISLRPRRTN